MPHHPKRLKPLMKGLGPAAPFIYQLAFSNLWLFGGVVSRIMAGKAQTDATIRTTTAVTVVTGENARQRAAAPGQGEGELQVAAR